MKMTWFGLLLGLEIVAAGFSAAENTPSLMEQADAVYAKRDDVTQDKVAMVMYEKLAVTDPAHAEEAYWKASRAAWWLGEHDDHRADRLADYQRGIDDAHK